MSAESSVTAMLRRVAVAYEYTGRCIHMALIRKIFFQALAYLKPAYSEAIAQSLRCDAWLLTRWRTYAGRCIHIAPRKIGLQALAYLNPCIFRNYYFVPPILTCYFQYIISLYHILRTYPQNHTHNTSKIYRAFSYYSLSSFNYGGHFCGFVVMELVSELCFRWDTKRGNWLLSGLTLNVSRIRNRGGAARFESTVAFERCYFVLRTPYHGFSLGGIESGPRTPPSNGTPLHAVQGSCRKPCYSYSPWTFHCHAFAIATSVGAWT